MSGIEDELVAQAWAALSADHTGTHPDPPAQVEVVGAAGRLPSHFFVEELAQATVAAALLAAAALSESRGAPVSTVRVDRGHVADAVRSERYFRVGGQPAGASFAPLSRFWPAADGWVRTHANYPWHRTALLDTLGTSGDEAAGCLRHRRSFGDRRGSARLRRGGIAAAVRTLDEWQDHPQGQAFAREPLIAHRMIGDAAPTRACSRRSARGRRASTRLHASHRGPGLHTIPRRARRRRVAPRSAGSPRPPGRHGRRQLARQAQLVPRSRPRRVRGHAPRPLGARRCRRVRLPARSARPLRARRTVTDRALSGQGRRVPRRVGS